MLKGVNNNKNLIYSTPSNLSNSGFFNLEASELVVNPFSTTIVLSFDNCNFL